MKNNRYLPIFVNFMIAILANIGDMSFLKNWFHCFARPSLLSFENNSDSDQISGAVAMEEYK